MDILSKLPFFSRSDGFFDDAEAKADRIAFHRAKVRNGPVSFREPTTGQIRRERKRALDRQTKKARSRQVRLHLLGQREASILRGQLQLAGVLSHTLDSTTVSTDRALRAVQWIHERFGEFDGELGVVPNTPEAVQASLQSALNRWESLVGLPPSRLEVRDVTRELRGLAGRRPA